MRVDDLAGEVWQPYLEAGMDDYITKPVKIAPLIDVISKWIADDGFGDGGVRGGARVRVRDSVGDMVGGRAGVRTGAGAGAAAGVGGWVGDIS